MNLFKALVHLPALLVALGLLDTDAKEAATDPELQAELENSPLLKARLAQISAEWRAVQEQAQGFR